MGYAEREVNPSHCKHVIAIDEDKDRLQSLRASTALDNTLLLLEKERETEKLKVLPLSFPERRGVTISFDRRCSVVGWASTRGLIR